MRRRSAQKSLAGDKDAPIGAKLEWEKMPAFLQPTARASHVQPVTPTGDFLARVRTQQPDTVQVAYPQMFTLPDETHEETHVFQLSRNPAVRRDMDRQELKLQGIRQHNPSDPMAGYGYGGDVGLVRDRREGKTIADFNPEQQAQMVSAYQQATNRAMATGNTRMLDTANAAYAPFVRQLASLPGRNDPMNAIDLTPRAPGLPPAAISGFMAPDDTMGGNWKYVRPR